MDEKVLCELQVAKSSWGKIIHEKLIVTPNRTFVIRGWEHHMQAGAYAGSTDIVSAIFALAEGAIDAHSTAQSKKNMREREKHADTPEKLLKTDKNNFALLNSEIKQIELKKFLRVTRIHITTQRKKYKWNLHTYTPKGIKTSIAAELNDYENMLRPVFRDKLSVKK
ncbi:MAG: hypothetical protein JSW72_02745 [Candidatus Bathyarchaeota archaeon]|nr:MAG: hypothetical protein JSW72_02745 [Candidatus Bathyarchaeota archaeon]